MTTTALTPADLKTVPQTALDACKNSQWTDTKVKRVWAAALAGVSLSGAAACTALAFTASLWFLAPAVPLLIAGGGLIWYCCASVDYDNPKELSKIREAASKMSLPQIVETHGWDNLTRYEILSPAQFERAYAVQAQQLDFRSLISYYQDTRQQLDRVSTGARFSVPEPKVWKEKFKQETGPCSFRTILHSYGHCAVELLHRYEIISEQEASLLAEGHKTLNFYAAKRDECEREFDRQTTREQSLRDKSIRCAVTAFESNPTQVLLDHLFLDYQRDLNDLRFRGASYWDESSLKMAYENKRLALELNLENARSTRERACALIKEQYHLATKPFREEADKKIAAHEEEKDRKIAEISERYEAFRRANQT